MANTKVTAEAPAAEVSDLPRVDEAIAGVERLYQTLTGNPPPPQADEPYTPIPVEKDAAELVTERLDRLIDALGQPFGQLDAGGDQLGAPGGAAAPAWSPPITVWENTEGLLVLLEVPGVHRQDLQLSDEGDSLTVKGRRSTEADGLRLRMTERPLGPFKRRIILPRGSGGGDLSARLQNGVLEIRIPKPKSSASGHRTIPIA
ncbi:MAG TPA: Hsp20/alpha crystallin family protein [Thermoanaerobaculia bacterium]|nr:Hsp20/alpha crystallin family protein [Thermoanaerobaculia bacterium]